MVLDCLADCLSFPCFFGNAQDVALWGRPICVYAGWLAAAGATDGARSAGDFGCLTIRPAAHVHASEGSPRAHVHAAATRRQHAHVHAAATRRGTLTSTEPEQHRS